MSYEEWAKNEGLNLKDPSLIPQTYPRYIDYWKRVYVSAADNKSQLQKFAEDNNSLVTVYYNYLRA